MHRHPFTADLPPEVITDILCRVPAKSLLQFRSTCKWWRSLIDSTHFIFMHFNKSIATNSNTDLILRQHSRLYRVDLTALDNAAVELIHPLMCYSSRIQVLGSCNGLLCISNIADDIAIWNPSLRKHRILPSEPLNRHPNFVFAARVYGFGYDSVTRDYKLVSISYFVDLRTRTFDSRVILFSLRSESWKNLPSMPYALCCARTMGVFVGGALHWVVTRKLEPLQPDLIVAFDLKLDSFNEVPLPVSGKLDMEVALLGECLCLIENQGNSRFDVWVMKEYGSRDSWCKILTVTPSRPVKSVKPLAYSRDGDKVLVELDRSKLFWYSLKSEDVIVVNIRGSHKSFIEGTVCVGSLVPPTLLAPSDDKRRQGLRSEKARKKRDDFLSQGFKLIL